MNLETESLLSLNVSNLPPLDEADRFFFPCLTSAFTVFPLLLSGILPWRKSSLNSFPLFFPKYGQNQWKPSNSFPIWRCQKIYYSLFSRVFLCLWELQSFYRLILFRKSLVFTLLSEKFYTKVTFWKLLTCILPN